MVTNLPGWWQDQKDGVKSTYDAFTGKYGDEASGEVGGNLAFAGSTIVVTLGAGGLGAAEEAAGTTAGLGETVTTLGESTAAESAAGDHLVLGIFDEGTIDLVKQIGGRTLEGDEAWRDTILHAVADKNTKFSVNLNGLTGSPDPVAAVENAWAYGGMGNTNWELIQLDRAGRLPSVEFYFNGHLVANPFR